jgi:flavin reductase (DIM6/NTAB) family NADH-FMN oxidoreductase RutF
MTDDFEAIAGSLDYPLFIVTTTAAEERGGCLVGFATQTSITPPRMLVGLSRKNHTYRVAREASALAVHAPGDDQVALAELFGAETGDEVDKFARCAWHDGHRDVPIIDRCENWFVGRVITRVEAGDHDGFLLEPVAASSGDQDDFTFHRAKTIAPGHPA